MKSNGARILVTGSSGTIGTALCRTLLDRGFDVTGVDIKRNKWDTGVQEATVNYDLRCNDLSTSLPSDVDLVIHLAANARVYDLVVEPGLARDNTLILYNVLEYMRTVNVKRLIFSSSREVYGNSEKMTHAEEEVHVSCCESPYAASKLAGEAFVHAFHRCYGTDFVILRLSNVYGKYDESDRVVPLFIKLTKAGKDLVVYGKDKVLDFTYIDDAIEGIMLCIERFQEVKNNTLNIASREGTAVLEVAQLIRDILGARGRIRIEDNRTGEVLRYVADISRAKKKLGYVPKTAVDEGIRHSVKWYEENLC